MKTGLCSVTFRQLPLAQIVELVKKAGLDAIEWGGDVHVPHGDLAAARMAARITTEAGLGVSSYGSYYRVLDEKGAAQEFDPVLETALELGVDTVRIWAGHQSSAAADAAYWNHLIEHSLQIADQAAGHHVRLAYEFHRNTLNDTNESAVCLLKALGHANLYTYWQPICWGPGMDYRLEGLKALRERVLNLHVFYWLYDSEKQQRASRPLAEGADDWLRYLAVDLPTGDHFALLEFVRDNNPAQFLADAETLKKWIKRGCGKRRPPERNEPLSESPDNGFNAGYGVNIKMKDEQE